MKKDQKAKTSQLSPAELERELVKEAQNLAKLTIDKSLAKLKNVHQIDESKKKIALIKTRLSQSRKNLPSVEKTQEVKPKKPNKND